MTSRVVCLVLVSVACVARANDADVAAILRVLNNDVVPNLELTVDGVYNLPDFHNDFEVFSRANLESIHDLQDYLHRVNWTRSIAGNSQGITRGVWNVDQALVALTNGLLAYFPSADRGGLIYEPNDSWGFLWYDGESEHTTDSHVEFETLVFGQNVDVNVLQDEIFSAGPEIYEQPLRDASFDMAFNAFGPNGFGAFGLGFWNLWQAEAWRRQLSSSSNLVDLMHVNVTNSAAWNDTNTRDETNIWNDVLTSSTNEVGQGIQPEEKFSMPTNSPTWFGPSDSDASVDALLPELDWELQGEANEVRLFGFDELDNSLTGALMIDFTSAPWPMVRSVLQFAIAVTTCCVLVSIVRSEVNYWTTLGGSAT